MNNKLLKTYIKQIKEFPRLNSKQEKYFLKYRGNHTKTVEHIIVESNLLLVVKIATQYHKVWDGFDIMDLIQEGNLGLLAGIKNFDTTKKVKLSTWVAYWIKAYIYNHIMWNTTGVTITKTKAHRKIFDNLSKEKKYFESKGIVCDSKMLAKQMDVPEKDVVDLDNMFKPGGITPIDTYVNTLKAKEKTPLDNILEREREQLISDHINKFRKKLTPTQDYIFETRMIADEPKTQKDLATILVSTQQNISNIEQTIIRKLKQHFDTDTLKELLNND